MIIVRQGLKADIPAALLLIKALAEYENAPEEVETTVATMEEDGFGEKSFFEFLVAEEAGEILGIAVYFYSYSTWKGRAIYLDDLVVHETHRRRGIGKMLFNALIQKAKEIGAKRLSWQVLEWNEPAIEFYKTLETNFDPEWVNCKLNSKQINNFKQK